MNCCSGLICSSFFLGLCVVFSFSIVKRLYIAKNISKGGMNSSRLCSLSPFSSPPPLLYQTHVSVVSESAPTMDTRGKTNAEFRNDVNEILARHESRFDQVNAALQAVLTELQTLRASYSQNTSPLEINPFARDESSHPQTSRSNNLNDHPHQNLKLSFPKFNGDDPTGWIYKAEQYFDFKNVALDQQADTWCWLMGRSGKDKRRREKERK